MKASEDFCKRIENLEDISLELMGKADTKGPIVKDPATGAKDANAIAKYAFLVGFAVAISGASDPRERMSKWTRILSNAGLSREMLDWMEGWMATIVHLSEELDEGKDR